MKHLHTMIILFSTNSHGCVRHIFTFLTVLYAVTLCACSEWDIYGFASPYEDGGVCENEGVSVWNGKLYLGMFTKCAKDGTRSNVFGFPLP